MDLRLNPHFESVICQVVPGLERNVTHQNMYVTSVAQCVNSEDIVF